MIAPSGNSGASGRGAPSRDETEAVLELLASVRARGIEVEAGGDRLLLRAPPGALDADTRQRLAASKAAILAFLAAPGASDAGRGGGPVRGARSGRIPLTHAQQRLWLLQQLEPRGSAYNVPYAFRIEGALDVGALTACLQELVARHDALRVIVSSDADGPFQLFTEPAAWAPAFIDLRAQPERLPSLLEGEARRPFDLGQGPLLRVALIGVRDTEHVLFFNAHHLVCDGWSIEILFGELRTLYDARVRGVPSPLEPLPIDYADYACWEQRAVTPASQAAALAFHVGQLAGPLEALDLPADHPRPKAFRFRGGVQRFELDAQLVEALRELGRRHQATTYMVMLAAFQVLLGRYSGQSEVLVGTPVAGRLHPATERLVGLFANTLVLRGRLGDDPSFTEFLGRVRGTCLAAYEHQALPFQWLVEALQPPRDTSRTPLFQALFTLQDTRRSRADGGEPRWTRLPVDSGGSKTDLTLLLEEHERGMSASLEFSTELFATGAMQRLARNYTTLLRSLLADPGRALSRLELIDPEERAALDRVNATARTIPDVGGFHRLVGAQAKRTPDRIAVVSGDETLSYAELERRANRLARRLIAAGVTPGSRVGVSVERGAQLPVATLGILKAGAAYVPLDPAWPRERLDFMSRDAGLTLVVSEHALSAQWSASDCRLLLLDRQTPSLQAIADGDPGLTIRGTDIAYVIYTSGSTGQPKGVMVPHDAVVNFLASMAAAPGCSADDRLVAVTTLSFDIAVLELFLPLTVGARVIVASRACASDGAALARLLAKHEATMMQATPVTWQLLIDGGWTGQPGFTALCGGEALPQALARELLARCSALWNLYGPTETTVWSSCARIADASAEIAVGTPIANTQFHVLDRRGQRVPFGVVGELSIGGLGVSAGYLGRPELTQQRFVPDPFRAESGARLYRTGDLVRQLPEGLAFVGRVDRQVKLRGHRIELGEIESLLEAEPGVARSAVVVREFGPQDRRLVAYLVGTGAAPLDCARVREGVRARLPDYMVPQHFVVLDTLPLTPNDKVDRQALPTPETLESRQGASGRPEDALEQLLIVLWRQVLHTDEVGVADDFFDIGGHSLLAVRLVKLINEACHARLPLAFAFEATTVRQQARWIDSGRETSGASVVPLWPSGEREPLFCLCGLGLYQQFARTLAADRPVYGVFLPVEAELLEGRHDQISVPSMAREYVAAIRDRQARGPYHLAGVSFGGVLAYEAAQQLRAAGEEVAVVAIMDVVVPATLGRAPWRWLASNVGRVVRRATAKALGRMYAGYGRNGHASPQHVPADEIDDHSVLNQLRLPYYRAAWLDYQRHLRAYSGRVVVFRASDREELAQAEIPPDCGWSALVPRRDLHCHDVPGDHLGILRQPNVAVLARALREHLDQPTRSGGERSQ